MDIPQLTLPVELDVEVRACRTIPPASGTDEPYADFAALFPLPATGAPMSAWEDAPVLTPRSAYLLYAGGQLLVDSLRDDFSEAAHGELGSHWALQHTLPPVVLRWLDAQPEELAAMWAAKLIAVAATTIARLETGKIPYPRGTAEEMVLHRIIEEASGYLDTLRLSQEGDPLDTLPEAGEIDTDFDWLSEVQFEDHDVLLLFEPRLDGIESDDENSSRAVNLHPSKWFDAFREDRQPEPFGSPARTTPPPVSLDPANEQTVLSSSQRWLDEVFSMGTAVRVADATAQIISVEVAGLDLRGTFEVVLCDDPANRWVAQGLFAPASHQLGQQRWLVRDAHDVRWCRGAAA